MKTLPIVAIIGQTNAGKSSLFNRLIGRREAIVAREEGTTRDNVVATVDDRFRLVDTAGLKDPSDDFEASIQTQIADAVASANLILVTLDSSKYISHDDKLVAKKALKSGKPIILVLNKSDLGASLPYSEFLSLGIKDKVRVSATTGQGIAELKEILRANLPADEFSERRASPVKNTTITGESEGRVANAPKKAHLWDPPEANQTNRGVFDDREQARGLKNSSAGGFATDTLKIALIGRPNVGKSSLFNTLAKKQQALVASQQGTTRDINRVEVKFKGKTLEILDTAGLRKPGKREVGIEKFSALRTLAAIEEAEICCLLIDSTEPHSKLDQSLAGQIVDAGKGIILVVTKTDLANEDRDHILNQLGHDFNFTPYAPVVLTSSETGQNVTKIFELATQIDQERRRTLKTSDLNKILADATAEHTPAGLKNTKPKLRYITQTDTCPPWFVVFGSDLQQLHWSYKRFLERKIREHHPYVGTPIKFSFKNRD